MSNTYQPWQIFTNEALRILKNDLVFLKNVNKDNEHLFAKKGMKSGNTVSVRLPARFTSRTGETYNPVAYTETSVPVTVRPLKGVDIDLPSTEWTLNIDDAKNRVLKPAMAQLVNDVERDCMQLAYQGTPNAVGTGGTIPTAIKTYNQARALMVMNGCPDDDMKTVLLSPDMQVEASAALATVFNPVSVSSMAYKKGKIGEGVGFEWFETANIWTHTVGTYGGTPLTNGATQTGASIVTDGWTATTTSLKKGDIITFAGVYNVNPMTRTTTGKLKQFTVTADTTTDGSGNSTIAISPAIVASGAFQNVSNAIADNSAIVVVTGASGIQTPQGMAFHRDAYTFAGINQELPSGTDTAYFATDKETGIQLRFIRDFDSVNNKFINRFDVLYAFAVQYDPLGCRILS